MRAKDNVALRRFNTIRKTVLIIRLIAVITAATLILMFVK